MTARHPRHDSPVPFPADPDDVERLTRMVGEIRMEWIDGRDLCGGCLGAGTRTYGDTSTWRRGCGGQAMTADVCDQCWGSGLAERPWPSRRAATPDAGPVDPRTTPAGLARELGLPCSPGTRSPAPSTPEERLSGWPWEVDERLIAAGYTLLGEVYRRAPVPAGWDPVAQVTVHPCVDCGARVEGGPTRCERCAAESGLGRFRDLAAAERDMPAGLLAGPPEEEYPCTRCTAGPGRVWGTTWDTITTAFDCPHCDGTGMVPRG